MIFASLMTLRQRNCRFPARTRRCRASASGADSTRMRRTPRSLRICAPTPNVRSTCPPAPMPRLGAVARRFRVVKDDGDARAGMRDTLHRRTQRPGMRVSADAEQVAQRVGNVHAHERRLRAIQAAVHQREVRALDARDPRRCTCGTRRTRSAPSARRRAPPSARCAAGSE